MARVGTVRNDMIDLPLRLPRFVSQSLMVNRAEALAIIERGMIFHSAFGSTKTKKGTIRTWVFSKDTVVLEHEGCEPKKLKWTSFNPGHSVVYAMHKPRGMLSSVSWSKDKPTSKMTKFLSCLPDSETLFGIGRLDNDTTGLFLVTSDGDLNQQCCTPGRLPKEYVAECQAPLEHIQERGIESRLQSLRDGVVMPENCKEGAQVAAAMEVELLSSTIDTEESYLQLMQDRADRAPSSKKRKRQVELPKGWKPLYRCQVRIMVNIGWNRVVRRMLGQVGLSCKKLKRSKYGPLAIEALQLQKEKDIRKLSEEETAALWQAVGGYEQLLADKASMLKGNIERGDETDERIIAWLNQYHATTTNEGGK